MNRKQTEFRVLSLSKIRSNPYLDQNLCLISTLRPEISEVLKETKFNRAEKIVLMRKIFRIVWRVI